jgi:hypothetical protein
MILPGYLRKATIAYYLQALVPHVMPADGLGGALQALFSNAPSTFASLTTLFVMIAVFLAVAGRLIERREYILEQ